MDISAVSFFKSMTDEDFMVVHKAGRLKDLCTALSIDLQKPPQQNLDT
jgi:hypothetical protein